MGIRFLNGFGEYHPVGIVVAVDHDKNEFAATLLNTMYKGQTTNHWIVPSFPEYEPREEVPVSELESIANNLDAVHSQVAESLKMRCEQETERQQKRHASWKEVVHRLVALSRQTPTL